MQSLQTSPRINVTRSKAHNPVDVPLAQYPDGSIYALSLSEPGKTYRVQLAPLACTCKGFAHRGQCCHAAAAVARFGNPMVQCYSCGMTIPANDAHTRTDGFHNHNSYAECSAIRRGVQAQHGVL